MKKILSVGLILMVLLTFTHTTAFAAEGTLELIEARNDLHGAVIFVFRFSGDFNKSDFKGGKVSFEDKTLDIDCNISDAEEGIVQCTASRAAAGNHVRISLAGFLFNTFVPLRTGGGTQYCYNVYDLELDESEESWLWIDFDDYCQDTPANFGDTLLSYPNSDGFPSGYEFRDNSWEECPDPQSEDAYYAYCAN